MSRIEEIAARTATPMEDTAAGKFTPEIIAQFVTESSDDIARLLERVRLLEADAAEGRRLVRAFDDCRDDCDDEYEALIDWAGES